MIVLGMPLFAWLGIFVFIILATQVSLGIAMVYYRKNVFKFHQFLGFTILALAAVHMIFALLFLLKGVVF